MVNGDEGLAKRLWERTAARGSAMAQRPDGETSDRCDKFNEACQATATIQNFSSSI